MKCFTLSYLRLLAVFCCFVCLQFSSIAYDQTFTKTCELNNNYFIVTLPAGTYNFQMTSATNHYLVVISNSSTGERYFATNGDGGYYWSNTPGPITTYTFNSSVSIQLENGWMSGTNTFTFRIWDESPVEPPVLNTSTEINVSHGGSLNFNLSSCKFSGTEPINYTTTSLPSWVNRSGNIISGTVPGDASSFTFDINASNSAGSAPEPCHVTVNIASGVAPKIWNDADYYFEAGIEYGISANVTGSEPMSIIFSNYPSFCTVNNDMIKFTIPLGYPEFTFKITAQNSYGKDEKSITVHVEGSAAPTAVTVTNFADLNNVEIFQKMELHLSNIDDATSASADHLENIDNNVITVLERLDTIIGLLQSSGGSTGGDFSGDGSLSFPDYGFDDFGDHTDGYTDSQIKDKTSLNQFNFIKQKLEYLKGVQPGGTMRFELPVSSIPGFSENPYIILSENEATSIYIAGCRRFFSVIVYIVGIFWWLQIIIGFFV